MKTVVFVIALLSVSVSAQAMTAAQRTARMERQMAMRAAAGQVDRDPGKALEMACGSKDKTYACQRKYQDVMKKVANHAVAGPNYEISRFEVGMAQDAVNFANSDCACVAKGDAEYSAQIKFVKTKLPALIAEGKKHKEAQ